MHTVPSVERNEQISPDANVRASVEGFIERKTTAMLDRCACVIVCLMGDQVIQK